MYTKILAPLDGSKLAEQVLPYAGALAAGLNISLKLFHAVDLRPLSIADPMTARYFDYEGLRTESENYLQELGAPLRSEGVHVSIEVAEGTPEQAILSELEQDPNALIAVTTHGRSGLSRWVLGSTAEKILHATTNPMLVIRSYEEDSAPHNVKLEKLIVPLDGSRVAEQILPHAIAVAKALRLDVYLIRSIPSSGEYHRYMEEYVEAGPDPTVGSRSSGLYEEFSNTASAQIQEYLRKVGDRFRAEDVFSVHEKILEGSAADAIIELAHETPNNLIAMTSHGRSGIGRWIMGSVSDRIVRYSHDPVLMVRATE